MESTKGSRVQPDADKNDETQYSNGGIWWLIGGCVVAAAAIAGYAIMIKRK